MSKGFSKIAKVAFDIRNIFKRLEYGEPVVCFQKNVKGHVDCVSG